MNEILSFVIIFLLGMCAGLQLARILLKYNKSVNNKKTLKKIADEKNK